MVNVHGMSVYVVNLATYLTSHQNNCMEGIMGIGSGIVLFVGGAIVAFALNFDVSSVDMELIGYLLMGAGVLVFLISLVSEFKKRSSSVTTRTAVDPARGERIVEQEKKSDTL